MKVVQLVKKMLWNPMVHYCVHKSPPLDLILSKMYSVHSIMLYEAQYFKWDNRFLFNYTL